MNKEVSKIYMIINDLKPMFLRQCCLTEKFFEYHHHIYFHVVFLPISVAAGNE